MNARLIFVALAIAASASARGADSPHKLFTTDGQRRFLFFLSAEDAFNGDGFSNDIPKAWQEQLKDVAAKAPCASGSLSEGSEVSGDRRSAATVIHSARAIFSGRISAVEPGVFYGMPGSLLTLRDLQIIKSDYGFRNIHDVAYVRHPFAHFRGAGLEFCAGVSPETHIPVVGDRVLVFAFGNLFDESGLFAWTDEHDLLFEQPNGSVHMPAPLRMFSEHSRSFSDLRDYVKDVADRDKRSR